MIRANSSTGAHRGRHQASHARVAADAVKSPERCLGARRFALLAGAGRQGGASCPFTLTPAPPAGRRTDARGHRRVDCRSRDDLRGMPGHTVDVQRDSGKSEWPHRRPQENRQAAAPVCVNRKLPGLTLPCGTSAREGLCRGARRYSGSRRSGHLMIRPGLSVGGTSRTAPPAGCVRHAVTSVWRIRRE